MLSRGHFRFAHRLPRAGLHMGAFLGLVAAIPLLDDGVYTTEQAARGHGLYDSACASCHGAKLEGGSSTPLAGDQFTASWSRPNLTLDDFYYIVRKSMPKDAPGSLTREQYIDIVAFVLQHNGFPPGDKELTPDATLLKTVRFGPSAPPSATAGPTPER